MKLRKWFRNRFPINFFRRVFFPTSPYVYLQIQQVGDTTGQHRKRQFVHACATRLAPRRPRMHEIAFSGTTWHGLPEQASSTGVRKVRTLKDVPGVRGERTHPRALSRGPSTASPVEYFVPFFLHEAMLFAYRKQRIPFSFYFIPHCTLRFIFMGYITASSIL